MPPVKPTPPDIVVIKEGDTKPLTTSAQKGIAMEFCEPMTHEELEQKRADDEATLLQECRRAVELMVSTAPYDCDLEISVIRRTGPPIFKAVQVAIQNPDEESPVSAAQAIVGEGESWVAALIQTIEAVRTDANIG